MGLDRNGYAPSVMDTAPGVCYRCGKDYVDTVRHEVFAGNALRSISKAQGVWINVCPSCHVAYHENGPETEYLHKDGEAAWLAADWSRSINDFVAIFGRNYL